MPKRTEYRRLGLTLGLLLPLVVVANPDQCAPLDLDRGELKDWRAEGFPAADADALVPDLLPCLAAPDPFLRDRIGFEGLSRLLRGGEVSSASRKELLQALFQLLDSPDDTGVARPFAILVLSEVARSDRVDPFLVAADRSALVVTAAEYLRQVTDYRGLIDGEGWRHGVAHGADLVLQLVLNPAVSDEEVKALSEAVFSQVDPYQYHAYVFGEPRRLARPVLYATLRSTIDAGYWQGLFASLADPTPMGAWEGAFDSEAGMRSLHNTRAFAQAIYIAASTSGRAELDVLAEAAKALLEQLP